MLLVWQSNAAIVAPDNQTLHLLSCSLLRLSIEFNNNSRLASSKPKAENSQHELSFFTFKYSKKWRQWRWTSSRRLSRELRWCSVLCQLGLCVGRFQEGWAVQSVSAPSLSNAASCQTRELQKGGVQQVHQRVCASPNVSDTQESVQLQNFLHHAKFSHSLLILKTWRSSTRIILSGALVSFRVEHQSFLIFPTSMTETRPSTPWAAAILAWSHGFISDANSSGS